jgi:hypothetical protein
MHLGRKEKVKSREKGDKSQAEKHGKGHINKNRQMILPSLAFLIGVGATVPIVITLDNSHANATCEARASLSHPQNFVLDPAQSNSIRYMQGPEQLQNIDPELAHALGSSGLKIVTVQGFEPTNPAQGTAILALENRLDAIGNQLSGQPRADNVYAWSSLQAGENDLSNQNQSVTVSVQSVTCEP